jgi:acyl carrier protein
VTTIDDFIAIVHDEIGLRVTADDIELSLDQVPGWDSVHLLALLVSMERATGRRISLPDVLEAESLEQLYRLAVGR